MKQASSVDPIALIQAQLDAYNARDTAAWLATYAPDARQYAYPDTLLAQGHAEMAARIQVRFAEPNLHARLNSRSVLATDSGHTVIDHETITRTFPEGPGELDFVAIYQVNQGLIQEARFISGPQRLFSE